MVLRFGRLTPSLTNIRVVSPFVGGAFGSALRTWPHVTLAALGSRVARRPVKVMLSRREMYYAVGYESMERLGISDELQ